MSAPTIEELAALCAGACALWKRGEVSRSEETFAAALARFDELPPGAREEARELESRLAYGRGLAQAELRIRAGALASYARALDALRALHGRMDVTRQRTRIARVLLARARILRREGPAAALPAYEGALLSLDGLWGEEQEGLCTEVTCEQAACLYELGRYAEAAAAFARARALTGESEPGDETPGAAVLRWLRIEMGLASSAYACGAPERALRHFETVVRWIEPRLDIREVARDEHACELAYTLLPALVGAAASHRRLGDAGAARAACERVLELNRGGAAVTGQRVFAPAACVAEQLLRELDCGAAPPARPG